jgi:hypothetical protein
MSQNKPFNQILQYIDFGKQSTGVAKGLRDSLLFLGSDDVIHKTWYIT